MSSNVAKPPKWRYSDAKEILTNDIRANRCKGKTPAQVYEMHPDEYKQYKYENFRTNYNNLKKKIEMYQSYADADEVAVANDKRNHPTKATTPYGYPRWRHSEAEKQLKEDVDKGDHKKMKPENYRLSNDEFKKFPLKTFRDHIYQEERDRRSKTYWVPVMKNRQKKVKKDPEETARNISLLNKYIRLQQRPQQG